MRLTRATEYAFRALRFLASRTEQRWYSIQEIGAAEDVPTQFLAKVMQHLTQAGIVQSACGKTGGYGLARPANEISMSEVLEAIEGQLAINECLIYPSDCRFLREGGCRAHGIFKELQSAMLAVLKKYSIADIAAHPGPRRRDAGAGRNKKTT